MELEDVESIEDDSLREVYDAFERPVERASEIRVIACETDGTERTVKFRFLKHDDNESFLHLVTESSPELPTGFLKRLRSPGSDSLANPFYVKLQCLFMIQTMIRKF